MDQISIESQIKTQQRLHCRHMIFRHLPEQKRRLPPITAVIAPSAYQPILEVGDAPQQPLRPLHANYVAVLISGGYEADDILDLSPEKQAGNYP